MQEGIRGSAWNGRDDEFPWDTTLYRELDCWELSISKKKQCLIIDTTEYHPGLLFLTKEDLQRAIEALSD